MHRRRLLAATACLPALAALPAVARAQAGPPVAAASDLKFALDEIVERFASKGNTKPVVAYGSSGNFHRQIRQGAPFELFLSADEHFVRELATAGLTVDDGQPYAIGRIVLFVPKGSPVKADADMADLRAALADGRLRKLAIANPEHAPYGRAAREALQRAGLWEAAQPKLVLGENVSQAAQFAAGGSAQAGIFALSLALAPAFGDAGAWVRIPEDRHAPLRQRMVLTKRAGPEARAFHAFLQQSEARAILARHGFTLPER